MFYNLVNLDSEFSGMAQKSVGFTGADINATASPTAIIEGGSALDQIDKLAFAVPDLMNTTWIVDLYNQHAWIARDLFFICLLLSVMTWLIGHIGKSYPEDAAKMILLLKRSVIAFAMIWNGIPILTLLLLIDAGVCAAIGGSTAYTSLMVHGITTPFGCVMCGAYVLGIFATGAYYVCRFFLIFVSCIAWIYAWILWIFDRTANIGSFILIMIVVNIFLATAMTIVFSVGAAMVSADANAIWVAWGLDVSGLIVMAVALSLPIIAMFYFLVSPSTIVRRTTHVVAKVI